MHESRFCIPGNLRLDTSCRAVAGDDGSPNARPCRDVQRLRLAGHHAPAPISSATAPATSRVNRARFSIDPPYSSVRWLELSFRKLLSRISGQRTLEECKGLRPLNLIVLAVGP